MEFFNSLTFDLKLLVVGIAGCALLALLSGNPRNEKRYVLVLAVLAAIGVYRFNQTAATEQAEVRGFTTPAVTVTTQPKRVPLVSTSGK